MFILGAHKRAGLAPILFLPTVLNTFFGQTGEFSAFLANVSFLLLFGAMFSYWVNLIFSKKVEFSQNIGQLPLLNSENSTAMPISVAENQTNELAKSFKNFSASNIANMFILFANMSLFLLLCIRWQESGHFPLSNLYESLIFLSWNCTTVQLFLIWYYLPNSSDLNISQLSRMGGASASLPTMQKGNHSTQRTVITELLGSVLAPCALFLNAFATFSLPKEMQQAGPLVPALQSNWLMMHVTVMIISYAALMVGSLLSIAYLILSRVRSGSEKALKKSESEGAASFSSTTQGLVPALSTPTMQVQASSTPKKLTKLPGWPGSKLFASISENLDYLSYRIIGIGFPFLTIGILSGAVWANEAWGSYWSWDPKETWALLTWFVFAIYLHTRLTKGWEGERPAILASFGFIVVWICYLGVNLLGEGLHSYGFFKG